MCVFLLDAVRFFSQKYIVSKDETQVVQPALFLDKPSTKTIVVQVQDIENTATSELCTSCVQIVQIKCMLSVPDI